MTSDLLFKVCVVIKSILKTLTFSLTSFSRLMKNNLHTQERDCVLRYAHRLVTCRATQDNLPFTI